MSSIATKIITSDMSICSRVKIPICPCFANAIASSNDGSLLARTAGQSWSFFPSLETGSYASLRSTPLHPVRTSLVLNGPDYLQTERYVIIHHTGDKG